jgi:hypothetical protein
VNNPSMRCAIYGRFSTNMQRAASIDDQIRQCREYAARQEGHVIVEEYVRSDQALTAGEWELLPEKKCVILVVARDGIEPPTPAFSGL